MYSSDWFNSLNKPFFNPPAEIFPPIWIILYTSLLVSLIIYSVKPSKSKRSKLNGYIYFIIQMLLNLTWSPVFFSAHNIKMGLIIIILMVTFTVLTILSFIKISKLAGIMLIPYLLWISFALFLNLGYMILN